jgi:biotin carboxyl carrier protein
VAGRRYTLQRGEQQHSLELIDHRPPGADGFGTLRLRCDGDEIDCRYRWAGSAGIELRCDGGRTLVAVAEDGRGRWLAAGGAAARLEATAPRAAGRAGPTGAAGPEVGPPMPAVVVRLLVAPEQRVAAGEALLVVAAMKMETTLVAPHAGRVSAVGCAVGDRVRPGDVLVRVEPEPEAGEREDADP